jgi:hypothetical protein
MNCNPMRTERDPVRHAYFHAHLIFTNFLFNSLPDDDPTVGSQLQSVEINVAHFKSRIPQLLYRAINTTENG